MFFGEGFKFCFLGSANYCDVDENGVQHIVLCRVIMGNMEVIHLGSEQCYPSSEDFDSGVDDLHNPRHYIIWNMNMNTHIYPEFVVSFKVSSSSSAEGDTSLLWVICLVADSIYLFSVVEFA